MLPEMKTACPARDREEPLRPTPLHVRGLQIATKKQQVDTGPLGSNMLEEWEG